MNPKNKWKIGAAIVLLTLAILLPEVVSAGWHIVHGRSVVFRSWKITVPFEWYTVRQGEGISMVRMSRLSWQKGPVATFLPLHFTKNYRFDYDVFGSVQARTLRGRGYLPAGQDNILIDDIAGRCWTFASDHDHGQVWIDCIVPKDLTSVDYEGPAAYAKDFLSVIGSIQRVTPAR
jgi:hypothetical protein